MAKKLIATVGCSLPGEDFHDVDFSDKVSLLDYDIVVFSPNIDRYISYHDTYQGKACLDDDTSFRLKESCEHWRKELTAFAKLGKTIFVLLTEPKQVYIATGQVNYSGTGRNARPTRMVTLLSNYRSLPLDIPDSVSHGKVHRIAPNCPASIQAFYQELRDVISYSVLLPKDIGKPIVTTKSGESVVGAIHAPKHSSGHVVLFPSIDLGGKSYIKTSRGEEVWTAEAIQLGSRLVSLFLSIDEEFRSQFEMSVAPEWVKSIAIKSKREFDLENELLRLEVELATRQEQKELLLESLQVEAVLRDCLYASGKQLESAVHLALGHLGFKVSRFDNGSSEYDVVFESPEGRLIGEIEGKDTKAVNIEKFRQLANNVQEDFARDTTEKPAKGILFGNGYRLTPPADRLPEFTTKCIDSAEHGNFGLLTTSELYSAAVYLADHEDASFAQKCRLALLNGRGWVKFDKADMALLEAQSVAFNQQA